MTSLVYIVALAAFSLAALLTGLIRRHALRAHWLDVPNERSSHTAPTPRGGGLAIVVAASIAFAVLAAAGRIDVRLCAALLVGGGAIAAIGFLDDRRPRPAGVRLAIHLLAAAVAVACLGGLPPLRVGDALVDLGWVGHVLGVLAIGWTLNLFNFMDGIDGIAAGEAAFIALAAIAIAFGVPALGLPVPGSLPPAALAFAAAALGFLAWNWPPAKIFMGDVGSGYLGFVIAVLAIAAGREVAVAPFVWLTLGGAFFADATVTLARRLARGERVSVAHRSHAYQWLARRWNSHRRVTVSLLAANLLWSLPLGWLIAARPEHGAWLCAASLVPWIVIAVAVGAGRPETRSTPAAA